MKIYRQPKQIHNDITQELLANFIRMTKQALS